MPKTQEKRASAGRANALQKPLQPSEELAAVVGSGRLPRGQVVSKMWEYIRSHNLQNPENRREILADDKLQRVFGKDKVNVRDEQAPRRPSEVITAPRAGSGVVEPRLPVVGVSRVYPGRSSGGPAHSENALRAAPMTRPSPVKDCGISPDPSCAKPGSKNALHLDCSPLTIARCRNAALVWRPCDPAHHKGDPRPY
jgi:upstream activation factor subunit UAF30